MSLISCDNLAFAYDGVTVLHGLNFKIEQGDYLCILGENGAGKSTLMKGLLGLKKPSAGNVTFGEDLRAREIGYLPQQTPVQKDFPASVREVVLSGCLSGMGMRPFFGKAEKERAARNMEALEITDLADRCYRDLSGGQQQRVLLARALCATKKVILLDEPVAGLDPLVTINMYKLIERINSEMGITVIMVSHDVQAATNYASHILHLGEPAGTIVTALPTTALWTETRRSISGKRRRPRTWRRQQERRPKRRFRRPRRRRPR